MSRRIMTLALSLAVSAGLAGCLRPQGALMPYSGAPATYWSTETAPKTVRVFDMRTNEVIFSIDIPAGKQLSLDFVAGKGDDPVYSPDLMRWQIFDLETTTGTLKNSMTVPHWSSRRIEVAMRSGPEYTPTHPNEAIRTDQLEDRPTWWTPEGGEIPDNEYGKGNYD